MNNEITFLIGAGAETGSTYGLPSGKYFKSDIIKNDNLCKIFGIFNEENSALVAGNLENINTIMVITLIFFSFL